MGRLLDDYLKRHELADATTLALIGVGCLSLLQDDDTLLNVRGRIEELEQDAHSIIDYIFNEGGYTFDPTFKDRQ